MSNLYYATEYKNKIINLLIKNKSLIKLINPTPSECNDIDIVDNKIYVKNKRELDKYINREIVKIFSERLEYYFNMFEEKIPVPNLKIRKMTSRWGVCNTKNHNVTLNYYLSRYDIKCLDYVVVHELSHFIHPNHSKNFWNLVSKYCPNYKECRRMLKE